MQTVDNTQTEAIRSMTAKDMTIAILALQAQVAELLANQSSTTSTKTEGIEMTDAMAEAVTYGEFASLKHKPAGEKFGLTYGQVYSARLEFTFKAVHKTAKDAGKVNVWKK